MSRVLISDLFPGNTGDMIYNNGNNWVRLTKGLTSQVLTLNSDSLPEWGSGSSYITSISDTSNINLDVTGGVLKADFVSQNISQFTNNSGYLTSTGITPATLTKTDDTNVTLTLGGTPTNSLLQAVSLTLGWTGTLADSRITSASTWNAKEDSSNKTDTMSGNTASSTKYLSSKGVYDWVIANSVIKIATDHTSYQNTGSTTENIVTYVTIPAGTMSSNKALEIHWRVIRVSGTAGSITPRLRISTSSAPSPASGATALALGSVMGTANSFQQLERTFVYKSASSTTMFPAGTQAPSDNIVSGAAQTSVNIDWTVTQYLIFTIQNANSGDTSSLEHYDIFLI